MSSSPLSFVFALCASVLFGGAVLAQNLTAPADSSGSAGTSAGVAPGAMSGTATAPNGTPASNTTAAPAIPTPANPKPVNPVPTTR